MKNNQKGFGIVEGMLLVVIVLLVGFIGYYVYHTRSNANTFYNNTASSNSPAPKTSANTKQTYRGSGYALRYPSDWKFVAKGTSVNNGGFASDEFLPAANYPDNNAYSILLNHETTILSVEQYAKKQSPTEGIVSGQASTINGYSAYTENYNVPGPSGAPNGYQVFVEHKGMVVIFNYTAQQGYTGTYKSIVSSIKFSN